jgi:hypothetical protein
LQHDGEAGCGGCLTTTYNMHHLVHYIKCTEYLQDKVNHISQARIDTDCKHVWEVEKV